MSIAITAGAAALGAGVGALLPLPAYRLSRWARRTAPADGCRAALPGGIQGWVGRGTCPACGGRRTAPVWRYAVPGAVAFALLGWRLPHETPAEVIMLAAWLLFAGAGLLFAAIDVHVMRLPLPVYAAVAATVGSLVAAAGVVSGDLPLVGRAGAAALVIGFAYLLPALFKQLGMGDVLIAALGGLLLGLYGWGMVFIGAILPFLLAGAILGVLLRIRRVRRDSLIPFVPYLAAGTLLAPVLVSFG